MLSLKELLSKDMKDFLVDSKWENFVKESINELIEYRPERPLLFLYEKNSIKSKVEVNNKTVNLINDLAFYSTKLDPLVIPKDEIISKLL
jgi:hypothetical protein